MLGPHIALLDTFEDGDWLDEVLVLVLDFVEVQVVDEVALLLDVVQVPKPGWQPVPQLAEVESLYMAQLVFDYASDRLDTHHHPLELQQFPNAERTQVCPLPPHRTLIKID